MVTKEEIIKASGINPVSVLNIYLFGSRVYGNISKDSDWDVIMIAKTSSPETEIKTDKFNIHILTTDRFQDSLDQHNIRSIECIMAPDWAKLQEVHTFKFNLISSRLRHSISHMNSNSWVKAKKKLNQGDYYIGIKSLWHSIRIVMYGIQIAKTGHITDWKCASEIWKELSSRKWTWIELDERFRKINNSLLTEFRTLAGK